MAQNAIPVGAEVEEERGGARHGRLVVERAAYAQVLEKPLVLGGALLGGHALEPGSHKAVVGDEHGREKLPLGRYPLQSVLHVLFLGRGLGEVFHIAPAVGLGILVVDGAVALLKHLALLVAAHLLVPVEVHVGDVGWDDGLHVALHEFHAHHVVAPLGQCVAYAEHRVAGHVEIHLHRCVVELAWCEVEILGVVAALVGVEHKAVAVFARRKQLDGLQVLLLGVELVVLVEVGTGPSQQGGACDHAALA